MTSSFSLVARGVCLDAPGGRPLLRDLNLSLGCERVAMVGRNGVGKSTLLSVLAGRQSATQGHVRVCGSLRFVPQCLLEDGEDTKLGPLSPGELRRHQLERARAEAPELLLLDEPTQDLDAAGVHWLQQWLACWSGALIVVSHDRRLLRSFQHFFVVRESGCRYLRGTFAEVQRRMEREDSRLEQTYARQLNRLVEDEQHHARVLSRRQRKQNVGRVREIGRAPARALLNAKRSYAQESQGKRAVLQNQRIDAKRKWAKAVRRALKVDLPLALALPAPARERRALIRVQAATVRVGERTLFEDLSLELTRPRLAVTGPNGCGKTTLLETILGRHPPTEGRVVADVARVGFIAQHASNWMLQGSLVSELMTQSAERHIEEIAELLVRHKFPLALAQRPLRSLSPGERVRAALICLLQRRPAIELLLLDEPTDQLDFLGVSQLENSLRAWSGGLVVVTHDDEFERAVGIEERLTFGTPGTLTRRPVSSKPTGWTTQA